MKPEKKEIEKISAIEQINNFLWARDLQSMSIKCLVLAVILGASAYAYYTMFFVDKYSEFKKAIYQTEENIVLISWWEWYKWIKEQIIALEDYQAKQKEIIEKKEAELYKKINSAIPTEVSDKSVALFFENLFLTISTKENPIVLTSVTLSWWANKMIDVEWKQLTSKKYPVSISFSASDKKYKQVLDIVQISGSFERKYYFENNPLPLMTTSSVQMAFKWNKEVETEAIRSRSMQLFMYTYQDEKDKVKN